MPVTPQQIASAATALDLQRLQTTLQSEAAADQADTNAKVEADILARAAREQERDARYFAELAAAASERAAQAEHRAAMLALMERQTAAAEGSAALLREQTDALLSRRGEAWMALYRAHLDARKSALSTATTDATLTDIVRDAVLMTNTALAGLDAAGV